MAVDAPLMEYVHTETETEGILIPAEKTEPPNLPVVRLVCLVGPDMGRWYPIGGKPLDIGRRNADIVLQGSDISRRHARIVFVNGEPAIEDLGSANGTYLNGIPVKGQARIHIGDRIQLGSAILVLTRHDELHERLQQLQKLDSMADLVRGLAHDFNNILLVLQVGLEELGTTRLDDEPRLALEDMKNATRSAASLIRRMQRIGHKRAPTNEPVGIDEIVTDTVAFARRSGMAAIEIVKEVDPSIVVRGSGEELRNALLNLILNARDAMPHGGQLSIRAQAVDLDRTAALALHLPEEGGYLALTVRDTGIGMTPETMSRIFEPFFTTKPSSKGSGLGLAMVFSTIRNHLGSITVESVVGAGSTFRILLPLAG